VRRLKDANPKQYERIFKDYQRIFDCGVTAIKSANLKGLGELMNENQNLLAEMTLSCKQIEDIASAATCAGAFGVKLTGTGRGGTVIALTPGKALQEKVEKAIEKEGYDAYKTKIGI